MQDSGSAEQDEHPLEGEGGEEDEYSDEDECFSQDSFEHNNVIASDEDEHSDQVKGNIMLAPPTLLTHGVKQHPLECSGPDCKASVEEAEANEEAPEEGRDAEVDERSSHRSTAEHHDAIASAAEADEASGANDEAEKEALLDMSKVSVPDGGDLMCPAPPCGSQESQAEVDQDSGLVLFQYFCAMRVPGFRAGLRLGGARRTSPRGRRR